MKEALAYEVDDVTPTSAVIALRWEKLAVPFKVQVNTMKLLPRACIRSFADWPSTHGTAGMTPPLTS